MPLATITGFTLVPHEPCRYKKRGRVNPTVTAEPLAGKIGGVDLILAVWLGDLAWCDTY
jgi:hypothetical protein